MINCKSCLGEFLVVKSIQNNVKLSSQKESEGFLKETWNSISDNYSQSGFYFYLTPSHYGLKKILKAIDANIKGDCLDLGAGMLTYKKYLSKAADSYTSVDKYKHHEDLDVIADALNLPFKDAKFDSIFCSQVLEHIEEPDKVLSEISRCLKRDGVLLLTVPHLSYLHGEPYDYYRFTPHAVNYLCSKYGLQLLSTEELGGLLSFISTPLSITSLVLSSKIPLFNKLVLWFNALFSIIIGSIDSKLTPRIYTLSYLFIVKKS